MIRTISRTAATFALVLVGCAVVPAAPEARAEGRQRAIDLAERRGRSVPVATSLEAAGRTVEGFGFHTGAGSSDAARGTESRFSVVFPREASGTYAVRSGAVSVAFTVVGAAPAPAEVERGKIAYREIFPGVDVVHQLNELRAEEFLVLRDPASTHEFTYELSTDSGTRVDRHETGGFSLRGDSRGEAAQETGSLQIEPAYVVDSKGQRSYTAARYEVVKVSDGTATIRLVVNGEGLVYPLAVDPTWSSTGQMSVARAAHTATILSNGRVLAAGGGNQSTASLTSCELYNPTTAAWVTTGSLGTGRNNHSATLLSNGKVLVAGGISPSGYTTSCELFDLTTKTWTATGALSQPRAQHTATLLSDGRVLVAGGYQNGPSNSAAIAGAEIYNPATGTWTTTGSLSLKRAEHRAVRLSDGRVLVAGGGTTDAFGIITTTGSTEIYNPSTGSWTAAAAAQPRQRHGIALISGGRVFVVGGWSTTQPSPGTLATAQIYTPSTNTWASAPSMAEARDSLTATVLSNGKVLAVGGSTGFATSEASQAYDPAAGTWGTPDAGGLVTGRASHAAVLLSTGNVLVCGGSSMTLGVLQSAELR